MNNSRIMIMIKMVRIMDGETTTKTMPMEMNGMKLFKVKMKTKK